MYKRIDRISTLLYLDNNYQINKNDIINKYIEGVFIYNSNDYCSIEEIVDKVEEYFNVCITELEIKSTLEINVYEYDVSNNFEKEKIYKLQPFHYRDLLNKVEENDLDTFIKRFYKYNSDIDMSLEELSKLIWDFIYNLFVKKLNGFSYLIGEKIELENYDNKEKEFGEKEEYIINEFLNYHDDDKNKVIFNIACYALEYCLFVSNSDSKVLLDEKLSNKNFYLDTNILYRALGLNGDRREKRTKTFLSKCVNTGQKLFISICTRDEFLNSINHHCQNISRSRVRKINPKVYNYIFDDSNLEEAYYEWANSKVNPNTSLFLAHIRAKLNMLIEDFSISIDKIEYLKNNEFSEDYEESKNSLVKNLMKDNKSAQHDSYDLSIVKFNRVSTKLDILDAKYFYISTDYNLKKWDEENTNYNNVPRILYPDQWLTILIKFCERTSEDFESFISFVNLSVNNKLINRQNFNEIVNGIAEITEDPDLQKEIVEVMVNKEFSMFKKESSIDYFETSKNYTTSYKDEKMENIIKDKERFEQENLELKNEIEKINVESTKVDENIKNDNKWMNKYIVEKEKQLEKEYMLRSTIYFPGLIFSVYMALCIFIENYNILNYFSHLIPSTGIREGIFILIYGTAITILFTFSINGIKKHLDKANIKKYVKENISV